MALSQSPPPFFRQGLSARIKLFIALAAAALLMQLDSEVNIAKPLRQGLSVVLYPIVEALLVPRDFALWLTGRLKTVAELADEVDRMREEQLRNAATLLLADQVQTENRNLRELLEIKQQDSLPSVFAKVRSGLQDSLSRKVLINKGLEHQISIGDPVINSQGVVGQVSRVFPLTSEVRLLSDEQLMVPVFLPSAGIRGISQGLGQQDGFQIRFVNLAAQIKEGDLIVTSGLDGLYPAGLAVGEIALVVGAPQGQFPTVIAKPVASVARQKDVLVIRRGAKTP
ncbi:MAG: rod shape-determining protein MreC [Burkholderiaceae bacterium]